MNEKSSQKGSDGGLEKVVSGRLCDVWLAGEALFAYRQLEKATDENSVKAFKQIKRWMDIFCERGPDNIPDTHFKHQGSFSCGSRDGRQATVFEFKGWQARIYGIQTRHENRRCFIGFRADLSKKQNKANRNKLEVTAKDAAAYI